MSETTKSSGWLDLFNGVVDSVGNVADTGIGIYSSFLEAGQTTTAESNQSNIPSTTPEQIVVRPSDEPIVLSNINDYIVIGGAVLLGIGAIMLWRSA